MPRMLQPRPFEPRKAILVSLVLLAFFAYTYTRKPPPRQWHWQGQTMGTTYSVKVIDRDHRINPDTYQDWQQDLDELLAGLNRQMSTYLADSEISQFNRWASLQPFPISEAFITVTRAALQLAEATDGALDPTLDPLIELWGFGSRGPTREPSPEAIAAARENTGYRQITVEGHALRKSRPDVHINVNAIAKGYGADAVLDAFVAQGYSNIFVEIGGEVACRGNNLSGNPWRIGVDIPRPDLPPGEQFAAIIHLDQGGVATSGDYRNFFEDTSGALRSHILNPASGMPAQSDLAAVTVVADSCMIADGMATALFVMGSEQALAWLDQHEGIEAMLQLHTAEKNQFTIRQTPGFGRYVSPATD
ncbi:MAG: FAD:protein FMN transferase [Kiritimatiellae bacterium]|nr:FAD:protein FMN transferase [Kiritimatiellia bacterium]